MRGIDGDILEKKLKDAINMCMSIDTSGLSELKAVLEDVEEMPTIEPRCETCEAFNKTRLLIPQPQRKKGKWIDDDGNAATDKYCATCSACGEWSEYLTAYCPNCGAEMKDPEDIPMEYFESGGR